MHGAEEFRGMIAFQEPITDARPPRHAAIFAGLMPDGSALI